MNRKLYKYFGLLTLLFALSAPTLSQTIGGSNEWGGVTDVFDLPVGARAMSMGGAYVSVTDDPFAMYWNPAALEKVPRYSLGLYYTNLAAGTSYNYLSYAHPTLFFGTFSVGVLRLATNDIRLATSESPAQIGTEDAGRTLFMFGYGYRFNDWFSLGTTLKIERAVFPNYPEISSERVGKVNESSFGADVGLLLTSQSKSGFLSNWSFGVNLQNAMQRSMKVIAFRETTPRNLRAGFSKIIPFGGANSELVLAAELDINEKSNVPMHSHFGFEYTYHQAFMLRAGYDHRGNAVAGYGPTFGGGIRQLGLQLDYSYWNGTDSFLGSNHRISMIFHIGKDRDQKLADLREREVRRIAQEVERQNQIRRREAIVSGMARANLYFKNRDYIRAQSLINKVLGFDETGEDPDFAEARSLLDQITRAIEAQRQRELQEQLARSEEEARQRRREQLIREHYDRAMANFEAEDYLGAIQECDRALEIDANSDLVKELRRKADEDLRKRINDLASRAYSLEKEGRTFEAIQYYNRALPLARGNSVIESHINGKIRELDTSLNYTELVTRAVTQEREKNFAAAAELYRQALGIQPNNQELRRKYEAANARANAKPMDMPENVKEFYTRGYRALRNKQYEEAIKLYEEARKLQPLNITILRALDYAQEQRAKQNSEASR